MAEKNRYFYKKSTPPLRSKKGTGVYKLQIDNIQKEFKYFQKNPEDHPLYEKEWQTFWQRRYFELKREGVANPENHDFKQEWASYWDQYITNVYRKEIATLKSEIETRLSEVKILTSSSSEVSIPKSYKRTIKNCSIEISSDSESSSDSTPPRKKNAPNEVSSVIQLSDDVEDISDNELEVSFDKSPVTLVSVLRITSALDTELGVLSNKVVDLLFTSLELEKLKPNSSEILITSENVIFLETVKEKLKGLISMNLMQSANKIKAAKKCVQNIAALIHQNRNVTITNSLAPSATEELKNNCDERSKLAMKIAKELEAQGKTDTTNEELEIIVDIYLEELKKKKDTESNAKSNNSQDIENLSDEDLKILIQNFSQLKEDEQQHLISSLTDMEKNDPKRVKNLQSFLNFDESCNLRENLVINDDEDEDYNFDDLIANIRQ